MKTQFELVHFIEIDSVYKKMQDDLSEGKPILNKVYYADFQNDGIGLSTNKWHSERAKNLLVGLAIEPENLHPSQQFMLTKAISLAMIDALAEYLAIDNLKIKWPNDIYYNNLKLAGILISNTIIANEYNLAIIGIGLNVNQVNFPKEIPNPVSLAQITHKEYELNEILNNVLSSISDRLVQLKETDLHHFISFEYLSKLFLLETWQHYRYKGDVCLARILGVNDYGQLILECEGNIIHHCDLKEVEFIL